MSLRWKLFLFLLAFSLIPMAVVSSVHRQETLHLGTTIGEGINAGISGLVARELTQTATDYAVVLGRSKTAQGFAVGLVAREAEKALADGGGSPAGSSLAAASDFGSPGTGPAALVLRPGYDRPAPAGPSPPAVSPAQAAWAAPRAPPGVPARKGAAPPPGAASPSSTAQPPQPT